MMTRDSGLWWWVMGGAVITALTTHFDLLHRAIPFLPLWVDPLLELSGILCAAGSGVMRMSPLPISQEGRQQAIKTKATLAGSAQRAVAQAAVEMDKAAVATDKAAVAAEGAQKAVDKVANT